MTKDLKKILKCFRDQRSIFIVHSRRRKRKGAVEIISRNNVANFLDLVKNIYLQITGVNPKTFSNPK